MAKKDLSKLASNFNPSRNKENARDFSSVMGEPLLVDFNLIRKNPLNTGNDKSDEVIDSLMKSIDTIGLLEPPIVYKDDHGYYTLLSGEGRYTAISKLKEKKKCFEQILVIVKPKPRNEDEELVWIISANEQRNTYSLDRTRKNIRQLCQHAKNLSEKGLGNFDDLIQGMTALKRASTYNYMRLSEDLDQTLLELFDNDQISVTDANFLCRYNKTEQKIIVQHFTKEDGKVHIDRSSVDTILSKTRESHEETFQNIDDLHSQIEEKDKKIKTLQNQLTKMEKENDVLQQRVLSVMTSSEPEDDAEFQKSSQKLKRASKKSKSKMNELKKAQEEIRSLQEKLSFAEQMLPSLSDEEIAKLQSKQELITMITSLQGITKNIKKNMNNFEKKYEHISAEEKNNYFKEVINTLQSILNN